MRILVASDSFKDGCTSIEACEAVAKGIRSAKPNVDIDICPIGDGGEGTVQILQHHLGGKLVEVSVSNPLFKKVNAHYLLMENETAFIEMAEASGLEQLTIAERNPLNTSTFGTGELIVDALNRECKKIIISVGGSATNDMGMGMISALGAQFIDSSGNSVSPIGYNMNNVVEVDFSRVDKRIKNTSFTVITDVTNPLEGPKGAAYVFGEQKGGDRSAIEELDRGLRHLWSLLNTGDESANRVGYGAAGGLGAGCVVFLNAEIEPGFTKISKLIDLETKIDQANIIITGEGHLDSQSVGGKVVSGLSEMSATQSLVVFCGKNDLVEAQSKSLNINQVIEISSADQPFSEALAQTRHNLESHAAHWAMEMI